MGRSQDLYRTARRLIPGGTQLLSKRPEMFLPEWWPAYYDRASGCRIRDLDGREYRDMSFMGIGSAILGYADPDVNRAVADALSRGATTTLNAPEEVALAELMVALHPWAHMVRYARTGGEAMAIAVRIARAASGKDTVLCCGYHGWHDWYLAANLAEDSALDGHLLPGLEPRGVPRALRGTSLPFTHNDTQGFLDLVAQHGTSIGAVVVEPVRNTPPTAEFLKAIRETCTRIGAPLIVDEITAGWRLNIGGAHLLYGLEPDIAVFAKAVSNGIPMAVVLGRREVMEAAQSTFISSTYWTDRLGPAAALATIRKLKKENVPRHLDTIGGMVQEGWRAAAAKHGVPIAVSGIKPLGHFTFDHPEPLVLKTLFTQVMLEEGFLATTSLYASLAHTARDIEAYLAATDRAMAILAEAMRTGRPADSLKGPVCHAGFRRLT
jgi:glutamate-1-semialdehyde aminotransferase